MAGIPWYSYPPLEGADGIRLLMIESIDTRLGEISCRIGHFDLKTAPPYRALSYEWGKYNDKCLLLLNGHGFEVGRNLWLRTMAFKK
jgi:hypothetical protein